MQHLSGKVPFLKAISFRKKTIATFIARISRHFFRKFLEKNWSIEDPVKKMIWKWCRKICKFFRCTELVKKKFNEKTDFWLTNSLFRAMFAKQIRSTTDHKKYRAEIIQENYLHLSGVINFFLEFSFKNHQFQALRKQKCVAFSTLLCHTASVNFKSFYCNF